MRGETNRPAIIALLLGAGMVVVVAVVLLPRGEPGREAREIDLSGLRPGGDLSFEIGKRPVVVSVPAKEGATFGTFTVASPVVGYHSGPVERDGSLETIWVGDVSNDGREDAVIVVRSGGSGSYVDLFVLEETAAGFVLRALPDLPVAGTPGYMGHDRVSVRGGVIHRSFPEYDQTGRTRIDRQWTVQDGMEGESPVKTGGDTNADPSGGTVRFRFDDTSGTWRLVP